MSKLDDAISFLKRVRGGASHEFGLGREDHRQALQRAREERGKDIEATRIQQMLGTNRTITMGRELAGKARQEDIDARETMGMGLSDDRATRIGQVLGTLGGDIVQDRGRELWWLINAPQALGNIAMDVGLKSFAPDLFKSDLLRVNKAGKLVPEGTPDSYPVKSIETAVAVGAASPDGKPKAGYSRTKDGYKKRRHQPGFVHALDIPTGIAINSGIGLLTPFGGAEGYKAVFPDEEDPSKTNNPVGEVAAKYLLGKTGNLLPWEEFKKVRPDVTKEEFDAYKSYKFDNRADLNPFDGDFVLPTGVLKGTTEGIHGPEVQFLGRSLPLTTALIPAAAAIGGTVYGARRYGPKKGLAFGLGTTAAGMLAGNIIEQERRRRNQAENEREQINVIDTIN